MSKTTSQLIQEAIDQASMIQDRLLTPYAGAFEACCGLSEITKKLKEAKAKLAEPKDFPKVER